jgi:lipopolysaccharide export system protein LptC
VLFWPQLNPLDNRFRLKPVQVSIDDLENLRMVSPRFVGTDARNQPFAITADQATQEAGSSDVTALANPKGDLTLNNGSWIALAALEGQYHKETRILDLWDEVNVFHDAGYEIKTRRAKADLGAGDVFGDDPVEGQGPDSQLRGQGFRIYEKGARIAITGKSRLVLYPTPPEKK